MKRDWRRIRERKESRWYCVPALLGGDSKGCQLLKISQEEKDFWAGFNLNL